MLSKNVIQNFGIPVVVGNVWSHFFFRSRVPWAPDLSEEVLEVNIEDVCEAAPRIITKFADDLLNHKVKSVHPDTHMYIPYPTVSCTLYLNPHLSSS
jgi:hypothetical protein